MGAAGTSRCCVGCGKPLSRFNDSDYCQACTSTRRSAGGRLPTAGQQTSDLSTGRSDSKASVPQGENVTMGQLNSTEDARAPVAYARKSLRQHKRRQRERMRAAGLGYRQIAAEFARDYRLRPRAAWREAYGWTLVEEAERINAFRGDTGIDAAGISGMTAAHLSEYEQWPGRGDKPTGRRPTPYLLSVLAEIFDCDVGELIDSDDRAHLPPADLLVLDTYARPSARSLHVEVHSLPAASPGEGHSTCAMLAEQAPAVPSSLWPDPAGEQLAALADKLRQVDLDELAQTFAMWAQRFNPGLDRREFLFKLSNAFALAAAAPVFDRLDLEMQRRVARVLENPGRLDAEVVSHANSVVLDCRRQGDLLGPQVALQSALAERRVVRRILESSPPGTFLREVQSAYAELTQLVGWLLFNLRDFRAAQHYYDEARTAAHDAHNVELVTYILSAMSHLATWQGKPRVGIDHAIAAQSWAARSGSQAAVAYAADVAARAYASAYDTDMTASGHADDDLAGSCRAALDAEQAALAQPPSDPPAAWWYFYDESFYRGTTSETALMLRQPGQALEAATRALELINPANVHNYALTLTLQSQALLRQGEIADACRILGDAARLTSVNSSRRIDRRIMILRGDLAEWEGSQPVQELDEKLEIYRPAPPASRSGRTNRS